MSEELEALREAVMTSLYKCAENSARYLGDERTATLEQLREHVSEYCKLDAQRKVATEALNRAKNETDSSNIDELEVKFNGHLTKLADQHTAPQTHPYMKQFHHKVSTALMQREDQANLDESDLAMTQTSDQHIDPITKRPIENPMKNKRCGHIYEQTSILELLKCNKRLRCPVVGCGNKAFIIPADLISDDELRFRLTLTQHSTMVQERSMIDLGPDN